MMTGLIQDVRCALRQLRKKPGFTSVVIVTLALGIGTNTAIYSLLDQALLRSLPVQQPDRLVMLRYIGSNEGQIKSYGGDAQNYYSYPMFRDIRDRNPVFSGVIATDAVQVGVQWHNQPELVPGELVSGNYFDVLGVKAAAGRVFVPSDDEVQNANPVAVLSFGYWKRRFGSDPHIVGQTILINGRPFSVVGIAQPGFHSVVAGQTPDVFTPMMMKPEVTPGWNDLDNRRSAWLNIIARLKPGLSVAQAEAGINPLWYSIRAEELKSIPNASEGFRETFLQKSHLLLLDASRGFSPLREFIEVPLIIIMAMVGLVALMACANVASLMLVRAAGRAREMSVRYALGAKRKRVMRQLLVEGLILGLSGGLLGILMASPVSAFLTRELMSGSIGDLPFPARIDSHVLLFNFSLSLFVSAAFSLAPAVQFWRPNLLPALKQQMTTAAAGPLRFRRASVAIQIGLSLLLLVGAGLFLRTLRNLKSLDLGFSADHLVIFRVDPGMAGYEVTQASALCRRILQQLQGVPGVRSVAATNNPEMDDHESRGSITVAGYDAKPNEDMSVQWSKVTQGYFFTLGIPLLAGRDFFEQDSAKTGNFAIVNESFARYFFGGPQQAIGHSFGWGGGAGTETDVQIVGVVKDSKHSDVRSMIKRSVFVPYFQNAGPGPIYFYTRTLQPPQDAESAIRTAMQNLDSRLALGSFRTMLEQIDDNLSIERMIAMLATSFAMLAVFMAAVGLFGVLTYSTAQRTREIGIRIALGATRATVMRMVLIEVAWLTGIGIAVGLPTSLLLARTVRSQLFGISNNDPLTLCVVIFLVSALALASAAFPARRAAKVDPMVALRYE